MPDPTKVVTKFSAPLTFATAFSQPWPSQSAQVVMVGPVVCAESLEGGRFSWPPGSGAMTGLRARTN